MPSALVLSYAFPPLAAPESWLAAKAVRSLAERDVTIDVVCARPRWWHSYDAGLVDWSRELVRAVHVVDTPVWLPAVQPVRWVRQFPDPMRVLHRRSLRLIERLDPERYDAILTWSQWHSAHLVGLELHRRHPGVRWVAHLSDPWIDNPLQPRHALARRVNLRMEGAVLEAADAVEFTSELARAQAVQRHPAAGPTSSVVPHTFEPSLYRGAPPTSGPIILRCVGSFYGDRTPTPFVRGLTLAGLQPDRVRVEMIGELAPSMLTDAGSSALPDGLLTVKGRVSYRDSLEAMRTADVLVMVDAPAQESVFVASKVADYVGARRPIVAITPEGAAADVVRRLGGWVANPRDEGDIARALVDAVRYAEEHRGDDDWGDPEEALRFDGSRAAAARAALLFGDGTG